MSDSDNLESEKPPTKKTKSNFDTLPRYQVNNNKKERQKRYRERNRDTLKQREAERRKRIQSSQSIAGPSTSSNTTRIELNNEEMTLTQRNEQGTEINALQNKRDRQRRYREKNRDKLKQREAERRRLQNAECITELYTSPNIEYREIIIEPIIIIDEVSTNSQCSWFGRNGA